MDEVGHGIVVAAVVGFSGDFFVGFGVDLKGVVVFPGSIETLFVGASFLALVVASVTALLGLIDRGVSWAVFEGFLVVFVV